VHGQALRARIVCEKKKGIVRQWKGSVRRGGVGRPRCGARAIGPPHLEFEQVAPEQPMNLDSRKERGENARRYGFVSIEGLRGRFSFAKGDEKEEPG
jgi:hypothetical protein